MKRKIFSFLILLSVLAWLLTGCLDRFQALDTHHAVTTTDANTTTLPPSSVASLADIPDFSGAPYVIINDHEPFFDPEDLTTTSYESYASLDALGRCGVAIACIGIDLMPTEDRGNISSVYPSGWQSVTYNGSYLYNRCHLIGFQLTGENANKGNLITGTRYMNVEGMLPFENLVADYIQETENHVMYRVTPVFHDNDLVAQGVLMEAYSVEDNGDGIQFNVFVYNVQPGITIDYATGQSAENGETFPTETTDETSYIGYDYVLNTSSKRFHLPDCGSINTINSANRQNSTATRQELIDGGYSPCGSCDP